MIWIYFLMTVSCVNVVASLFLTGEEKEKALHQQRPLDKVFGGKDFPLKLQGIFYRPDLHQWIVWMNHHRFSSECPQSIDGWTIVSVDFHSITVRSAAGKEVILTLETPAISPPENLSLPLEESREVAQTPITTKEESDNDDEGLSYSP